MLKFLLSVSLLISFLVLLTPRTVWHECKHHDLEHHHASNEQTFDQNDCFACDFDLGIISQPTFIRFIFDKVVYVDQTYTAFSFFTKDKFQQFSHRGPPTV
jgi:hypothetical protein